MKNILTISLVLALNFTLALASTTPETLFSNEEIEVFVLENESIFNMVHFNTSDDNLSFSTTTDIQFVQIFNATGKMEFQLPVLTDQVKINRNLFDKGEYRLGFILVGDNTPHFTQVTIK